MYHFRVDPDHDPVTDILKGIFAIVGQEQYEFCENFLINFFEGACLTSNKLFDFNADRDQDPDPGIFNGIILPLRDR